MLSPMMKLHDINSLVFMNKDQLDHLKDEVTQFVADNMGLNTDVMNGKGTLMGRTLLVVQSLIRTKKETSPLPPLVALSQFMEKTQLLICIFLKRPSPGQFSLNSLPLQFS